MTDILTEAYLAWLEPQLRNENQNQSRTYWDLIDQMFRKEFVYILSHDDSRLRDGLELRAEFKHEHRKFARQDMDVLGPCSFLEVLIGLSRRLAFAAGGEAPVWSWQLMDNLGIHRMVDPLRRSQVRKLHEIMEAVIFRTYEPSGQGGFFPLIDASEDQTKVELWYQMAAYLDDLHPEH